MKQVRSRRSTYWSDKKQAHTVLEVEMGPRMKLLWFTGWQPVTWTCTGMEQSKTMIALLPNKEDHCITWKLKSISVLVYVSNESLCESGCNVYDRSSWLHITISVYYIHKFSISYSIKSTHGQVIYSCYSQIGVS
jgi:hypothetical protein